MVDEAKQLIDRAREVRERAMTPVQRAEREWVDARNRMIQAGVRAPASGIYGRPAKKVV